MSEKQDWAGLLQHSIRLRDLHVFPREMTCLRCWHCLSKDLSRYLPYRQKFVSGSPLPS